MFAFSSRTAAVASAIAFMFVPLQYAQAYRPFSGTDASVAEPRQLETEVGPLGYVRVGQERLLVIPELEVNYGAGSGFEFGIEARRLMEMSPEAPPPRFDDFDVSVKRVLRRGALQDRGGPSIATEESVLLPTTEEPGVGLQGSLVFSQVWSTTALHLNGAISKTRAHELGRFGSAIFVGPERWMLRPVAEVTLERDGNAITDRGLLVGALWDTRKGLVMDLGFRMGYGAEREAGVRAGLTFNKHVPHGPKITSR